MAGLTAERLDPLRWMAAPMAACVVATLLFAAPIKVFGLQLPEPVFAMVPAFAWAVLRPSILGPAAVLLLGLFCDLVWGGRLGLWGLGLLVAFGFVLLTRNMMSGQSRLMMWVWYVSAWSAGMGSVYLAVLVQTGGNAPSILAVAGQWLPTALLYPLADRLIGAFEDADPRFR
jgi:rod shape-determining protein MreD